MSIAVTRALATFMHLCASGFDALGSVGFHYTGCYKLSLFFCFVFLCSGWI